MSLRKVVLFGNSNMAVPALQVLIERQACAGVVVPNYDHGANHMLQHYAKQYGIPVLVAERKTLSEQLKAFLKQLNTDAGLVVTFPFKIPEAILTIPAHGFFNVHPAQLPAYRGSDPLFWQIRNREEKGSIVVHKMNAAIDQGPILFELDVPISTKDTYGMHFMALQSQTISVINQWMSLSDEALSSGGVEQSGGKYWPKPTANDFRIQWTEMKAADVQALVNATNPRYQGAVTYLGQIEVRLLSVEVTTTSNEGITPGTLTKVDGDPLPQIQCVDQKTLRLKVVMMEEGILHGKDFADYLQSLNVPDHQRIFV